MRQESINKNQILSDLKQDLKEKTNPFRKNKNDSFPVGKKWRRIVIFAVRKKNTITGNHVECRQKKKKIRGFVFLETEQNFGFCVYAWETG